jgi:choice-of-anchor A domain-containing protein/RHS repeat-associated protein
VKRAALMLVAAIACGQEASRDLTVPSKTVVAPPACVDFGPAKGFGVFVTGSFNASGSDVQGSLAAGLDVSISAYSVGALLTRTGMLRETALVAGRNFTFSNGYVGGNAFYNGTANVAWNGTVDGVLQKSKPIDFTAAATALAQRSQQLAAIAANGQTVAQYGGITLTGTDPRINVFDVQAATLSAAWGVQGSVPSGSQVLINVHGGPDVSMRSMSVNVTGAAPDKLVMNFPQAATLTIYAAGVPANLIAPSAAVHFDDGLVTGTIAAKSFNGGGQVNLAPFVGCIPTVTTPPPGLALALAAPRSALPGSSLSATVTATNTGSGPATSATATLTLPDGSTAALDFGALDPAASATRTVSWPLPAAAARGATESSADYAARLQGLDGLALAWSVTGTATGSSSSSASAQAATVERLPRLTLAPATATLLPGEQRSISFSVNDVGTADAAGALLAVPDGVSGPIATGQGATISAAISAPASAVDGDGFSQTPQLTWTDAHGTSYGPIDGSFQASVVAPVLTISAVAPAEARAADVITYQLTLSNTGHAPAAGIAVASPTAGAAPFAPELAAGASSSVPLPFTVPVSQPPGPMPASFAVTWQDARGTSYGPAAAATSTNILAAPLLSLTFAGDACVSPGFDIAYTAGLTNIGDAPAQSTSTTFVLPDGTSTVRGGGPLAEGASASATASYHVPALSGLAGQESAHDYLTRLGTADGTPLPASASTTWVDGAGIALGPVTRGFTSVERVPILLATAGAPLPSLPGQPMQVPFSVQNVGGGNAYGVRFSATGPTGPAQPVPQFNLQGGQAHAATLTFAAPSVAPRQPGESDDAYLARLQGQDGQLLEIAWSTDWLDGSTNLYGPLAESTQTFEVLPIVQATLTSAPQLPNGQPGTYTSTFRNVGSTVAQAPQLSLKLPDGSVVPLQAPAFLAPGDEVAFTSTYAVPASPSSGTLTATASASWKDAAGSSYGPLTSTRTVPIAAANTPPVVSAGADLVVTLPLAAQLAGSVADDGLPAGHPLSIAWQKTAGPGDVRFANPAAPATSASFSAPGQYLLELTADDGEFFREAAVRVSVLPGGGQNQPPAVSAGAPQTGDGTLATLNGSVQDDGLPEGVAVTSIWEQLAGPAAATIANPAQPVTDVALPVPGTYSFRLTASDSEYSVSATTSITRQGTGGGVTNQPPLLDPGQNLITSPGKPTALAGKVTDDGLPAGAPLTASWSQVSGPGPVTFANAASPATTATFGLLGTYVLRLTASDTEWITSADIFVTVLPPAAGPTVSAGPDQTVTLPAQAQLAGVVADADQPPPQLTVQWVVVSGPGQVSFANPGSPRTQVAFAAAGSYQLELRASDGTLSASSRVTITVLPARQPPVVSAGPDQTLVAGTRTALLAGSVGAGVPSIWTQTGGLAPARFADPRDPATSVGFDLPGVYTLRLTAFDGTLSAFAEMHVTVPSSDGTCAQPLASLDSALDGARLLSPTPLKGSLSCGDWSVQVSLDPTSASPAWTTIGSGSGAANGTLATLDPTQLLNGTYAVRVVVVGSDGILHSVDSPAVVVDKNQKVGNFAISFNDLTVGSPGLPITVKRSYDSKDARVGDFGRSWQLSLGNVRIEKSAVLGKFWEVAEQGSVFFPTYCLRTTRPTIVTATFPTGKVYRFQASVTPACQPLMPIETPDVVFTPMEGTVGSLSPLTSSVFAIYSSLPGPVQLFDTDGLDVYDETRFALTVEDGTTYFLRQHGQVEQIQDPRGNTLTLTSRGIISSSGASVLFTRDAQGRIAEITDANGASLQYQYDPAGNLISFTDRAGAVTTYGYDGDGRMVRLTDPHGVDLLANGWDENGRLASTTDASGQAMTFAYDAANNRETVTDRTGAVTTYDYDADGNVVRLVDGLGNVTTSTFDANDNKISETDPLGHTRRWSYDAQNNKLSETDALGRTTHFTYGPVKDLLTTTDPLGHVTTEEREDVPVCGNATPSGLLLGGTDALGQHSQRVYTQGPGCVRLLDHVVDARGGTSKYTYDGQQQVTSVVDALGNSTSYTYDANGNELSETRRRVGAGGSTETLVTTYELDAEGRRVKTTFPDGSQTATAYDPSGRVIDTTDALGRHTSTNYDAQGRPTSTTYPDGTASVLTYDGAGRRTSTTDRAGRTTTYEYDAAGRLVRTVAPDGGATSTEYDSAGHRTATVDALGHRTVFEYDAAGRQTKMTDPTGRSTVFAYDDAGNKVAVTDALGNTTRTVYDALNRAVSTVFADGTHQDTEYDASGNRTASVDALGHRTVFQYDLRDQLVSVTDALGQVTSYTYDDLGDLTSQTDANGHTTRFEYDSMGRRLSRTLPLGEVERFSYTADGKLRTRTDFNGRTTSYAYDQAGRLVARTPDAAFAGQAPISFTYHPSGQRRSMTDASGTTSYAYDARDRLVSKSTPEGTLSYAYDFAGNVTSVRSDSGAYAVDYAYDASNRLTTVTDRTAGGATTYLYDGSGRLSTFTYPDGVTTSLGYDVAGRVRNLDIAAAATPIASYAYTLLADGKRSSVTELSGRVVSWSYDALSRLTNESISGDVIAGSVAHAYDPVGNRLGRTSTVTPLAPRADSYDADDRGAADVFDANGNMLRSAGSSYVWDSDDKLVSANSGQVAFVYDGDGQLVSRTAEGITASYLIDDHTPVGHTQIAEERTSAGVVRSYVYGLQRIALRDATGLHYYGMDGHSGVRQLFDATGAVSDTYQYDAYGNVLARTGTTENPFTYRGEQVDQALGLQYLRARWLDRSAGRFVARDRWEGDEEKPASLHGFVYANANPVQLADPSGFISISDPGTGMQVHSMLLDDFIAQGGPLALRGGDDPISAVLDEYFDVDSGLKIRPDLYEVTSPTTISIWEIKPNNPWSVARGVKQLAKYSAAYAAAGIIPSLGSSGAYQPMSGFYVYPLFYITTSYAGPGLIVYDVDRTRLLALVAAASALSIGTMIAADLVASLALPELAVAF